MLKKDSLKENAYVSLEKADVLTVDVVNLYGSKLELNFEDKIIDVRNICKRYFNNGEFCYYANRNPRYIIDSGWLYEKLPNFDLIKSISEESNFRRLFERRNGDYNRITSTLRFNAESKIVAWCKNWSVNNVNKRVIILSLGSSGFLQEAVLAAKLLKLKIKFKFICIDLAYSIFGFNDFLEDCISPEYNAYKDFIYLFGKESIEVITKVVFMSSIPNLVVAFDHSVQYELNGVDSFTTLMGKIKAEYFVDGLAIKDNKLMSFVGSEQQFINTKGYLEQKPEQDNVSSNSKDEEQNIHPMIFSGMHRELPGIKVGSAIVLAATFALGVAAGYLSNKGEIPKP